MPKSDHPLTGATGCAVPKSYRNVVCLGSDAAATCANCANCTIEYTCCYCVKDGSVGPEGFVKKPKSAEGIAARKLRSDWCRDHGVDFNGLCDEYEKEKP